MLLDFIDTGFAATRRRFFALENLEGFRDLFESMNRSTGDSWTKRAQISPGLLARERFRPEREGSALPRSRGIHRTATAFEKGAVRIIHLQNAVPVIECGVSTSEFCASHPETLGHLIEIVALEIDVRIGPVMSTAGPTVRKALESQSGCVPRFARTRRTARFGGRVAHGASIRDQALLQTPGTNSRNVVPMPGLLSTSIRPWWASTVRRTIARPSPVPDDFVEK